MTTARHDLPDSGLLTKDCTISEQLLASFHQFGCGKKRPERKGFLKKLDEGERRSDVATAECFVAIEFR